VPDPADAQSADFAPGEEVPDDVKAFSDEFAEMFSQMMEADLLEQSDPAAAEQLRKSLRDEFKKYASSGLSDYRDAIAELTGINLNAKRYQEGVGE
jgi:hypothetical protein